MSFAGKLSKTHVVPQACPNNDDHCERLPYEEVVVAQKFGSSRQHLV